MECCLTQTNTLMNTQSTNREKLMKEYFQLSSTIFASNSPKEIKEIKIRLWEMRKIMKFNK